MRQHAEYQYLNLLQDILDNGVRKVDRGTGDASYSVFGRQIRFDLAQGFPLLTTKRVYWKGVLHELYWFLSGQSNIKYLVDNDVHIWDDYPYRKYKLSFPCHSERSRAKRDGVEESLNVHSNRKGSFDSHSLAQDDKEPMTKEEFIEKIKADKKFAKKWGNLARIYGELWRRWPTSAKLARPAGGATAGKPRTIDQLKWAVNEVMEDPACHNAIVTSWNPEYLYTMARYEETSHFPICHNMYQLNVNEGKLSLQLYQRSADIFLGVPFNIASYALLTLIIAKVTGYKPGEFVHTFGDVHIYEMHIDQVKEQLKRKPRMLPQIKFIRNFKTIDDFRPEDVVLENYNPYPPIKASLSVTGGYFGKKKNIFNIKG